jgi:hypothetical protein
MLAFTNYTASEWDWVVLVLLEGACAAQSRSGMEDAIDNVMGLTPHASRVNGTCVSGDNSVAFYVPLLNMPKYPEFELSNDSATKPSSAKDK